MPTSDLPTWRQFDNWEDAEKWMTELKGLGYQPLIVPFDDYCWPPGLERKGWVIEAHSSIGSV